MFSARAIDHLVLATHDLDAAGAFYEKLGFKVGARNRHPWGTENRIVQFPGAFLELITVGEGADIPEHTDGHFSFGAFVQDYLKAREGFAMLVLESNDAKADKAAFDKTGIGGFEPFFFERKGVRPNGAPVEVSFTLAFARDRLAEECGFFVCQQHRPENFWNPLAQQHPNGATSLAGVCMVAEEPSDHAEFMRAFTGIDEFSATSAGLRFVTPRGEVEVLSDTAFAFEYGQPTNSDAAWLAAFSVTVPDLDALKARLSAESIRFYEHKGHLVVPPSEAFGVSICFVQS
jgi:catechol 2,3-dioxygenase-like lactoylglutathione lyase family enzyme